MTKKIRILFYSEGWGLGGIERLIMNIVRSLDSSRFEFDIFSTHDWDNSHDKLIKQLNGQRFTSFPMTKPPLIVRYIKSPRTFKSLLARKKYDIVHINLQNSAGLKYAKIARKAGVPVCISQAHCAGFAGRHRLIKTVINTACRFYYRNASTVRLAVSQEAGEFIFKNKQFTVIANTIHVSDFAFDSDQRIQVRSELGVPENSLIFGAASRIDIQKNPLFQVEILKELDNLTDGKCYLLLVGSGPMEDQVKAYAAELNLGSKVLMPGRTNDVGLYLNAYDVISLPSYAEGSSFTTLESIANGLGCAVSSTVPALGNEPPQIMRLSLDSPKEWADKLLQLANDFPLEHRRLGQETAIAHGLDSSSSAPYSNIYCTETTNAA